MVDQTFRMMQMHLRNVQTKNPNVFTWANLNAQKCKSSCLNLEMRIIDYMNEISFGFSPVHCSPCKSRYKVSVNSPVGQVMVEPAYAPNLDNDFVVY